MHQVLTTKYRPQTFEDTCGQKHIILTLQNAIKDDRLANAYIFAGPRGSGKTTLARIFAKTINCKKRKDAVPCLECESCRFIHTGSDQDVVELDAASNRNVEDIRTLREHAFYVPLRSKYKIFILDEAHMLTKESFNTLLKILEEPPPHIKFFFATTELNKVPDTIASRCQVFEFKRLSGDEVVDRLTGICKKEKLKVDEKILRKIGGIAAGSLRDSLSLLEQLITFKPEPTHNDLNELIGLASNDELIDCLTLIADSKPDQLISAIEQIYLKGTDFMLLSGEFISVFNELLTYKLCKSSYEEKIIPELKTVSPKFTVEHLLYCIQLTLNLRKYLRENIDPLALVNSYFIKMSMFNSTIDMLKEPSEDQTPVVTIKPKPQPTVYAQPSIPEYKQPQPSEPVGDWGRFLTLIQDRTNNFVKTFLQMCKPEVYDDEVLIKAPASMNKKLYNDLTKKICEGEYKKPLEQVIMTVYNKPLKFSIKFDDQTVLEDVKDHSITDDSSKETSKTVSELLKQFPGSKVERS